MKLRSRKTKDDVVDESPKVESEKPSRRKTKTKKGSSEDVVKQKRTKRKPPSKKRKIDSDSDAPEEVSSKTKIDVAGTRLKQKKVLTAKQLEAIAEKRKAQEAAKRAAEIVVDTKRIESSKKKRKTVKASKVRKNKVVVYVASSDEDSEDEEENEDESRNVVDARVTDLYERLRGATTASAVRVEFRTLFKPLRA